MDEMSDMQRDQEQDSPGGDRNERPDAAGSAAGEAPAEGPGGGPLRLRSFSYIDHALKLLNPQNTTLSEEGRVKLVDELLARMVQDDALPEERFSQAIPEVQSLATRAFATFATRVLREGNFSVVSDHELAYYPFQRLGKILRPHLVQDLNLKRAADLLLLDTAVEALVQARILLGRATPLSSDNGPPPGDEKLYRSQAVQQQKLFVGMMNKLMPKPVRRLGRPPATRRSG